VIFAQVKMVVRSQLHVVDDVQPEHFTPWATSPDPRCTLIRARPTVVLTAMPGCRSHPGACGMFNINRSPSSAHGLWHPRPELLRLRLPWPRPPTQRRGPVRALPQHKMASLTNRQTIQVAHISQLCWQTPPRTIPCSRDIVAS
jgi:hypothetical protein